MLFAFNVFELRLICTYGLISRGVGAMGGPERKNFSFMQESIGVRRILLVGIVKAFEIYPHEFQASYILRNGCMLTRISFTRKDV